MEQSRLLTMKPQLGAYFFSLLTVFAGVFALRGDLLDNFVPEASAEVVEEVAETEVLVEEPVEAVAVAVPLTPEEIEAALRQPRKAKPLPPALIDEETLWLARCIYSETKRPEEQEMVAWVVRNRVETGYRGERSYRNVVLDPYQFSAFNPGTRTRARYLALTPESKTPGWQRALHIAYAVRHADPSLRPFPRKTRHFYSERSMVDGAHPEWANGMQPVTPRRPVKLDAKRFRFYTGVY